MGWGPCQTDGTICSEDLRLQFSKDRFQKEDPAIALLSEDGFDYLLKLAPSVLPAVSEHPPTLHVSITACKIPKSPAEKFRFGRVTQTRDLEEEQFPSLNRTGASSDARADLSWLSSEQGVRTVIGALKALTSLKSWDYPNDTPSEATGRGRSTMVDVVLGKMGSVCGSEEDLVRTLIGIYTARNATDDGSEATGSKGNTVSPKDEVESDWWKTLCRMIDRSGSLVSCEVLAEVATILYERGAEDWRALCMNANDLDRMGLLYISVYVMHVNGSEQSVVSTTDVSPVSGLE